MRFMKTSYKVGIALGLIGLSSSFFAGFLFAAKDIKPARAETSKDWNSPASATSADYGTYYSGITGTSGMTLKDQLTDLIDGHTVVSYDGLYEVYKTSDNRPEDNTVFDMYADIHFSHSKTCGNYGKEGDCFNREHSVPKSWFGEAKPMYSDAFHLYPTDGKVNGMRGNYAFGEVASASYSYTFKNDIAGTSKRGSSKRASLYNDVVFEPADCYKGDFARTYFYFATRYKTIMGNMSGAGTAHFTASTTYCNLTQYSKELFLDWHRNDPVSKKEIIRNNAIYQYQHNRNPYIDHPEYVEAIWGDTPIGAGWVHLSDSSLSIPYDGSGASLIAESSDNSQITWTTSNATVATLSSSTTNSGVQNTVVPHTVGSATITAKATIDGNNYSASCLVTVTKNVSTLSYTGTPKKVIYIDGDSFDPTGLTVTAKYTDSSEENVTNLVTWQPNPLTEGTTSVTGSYGGKSIIVTGLTVNHNDSPASDVMINMTDSEQITTSTTDKLEFKDGDITITINKNTCQTAANNYCPPKYAQTRAYSGQILNISAGGKQIESILINCVTGSTNGLANGIWTNGTATSDGTDVTATPTDPSSDVSCLLNNTVKINNITVSLKGQEPEPPEPPDPPEPEDNIVISITEASMEIGGSVDIVATTLDGSKINWSFSENGLNIISVSSFTSNSQQAVTVTGLNNGTVAMTGRSNSYNDKVECIIVVGTGIYEGSEDEPEDPDKEEMSKKAKMIATIAISSGFGSIALAGLVVVIVLIAKRSKPI